MRIRKATLTDLPEMQNVAKVLKVPGRPWCDWHTKRSILPILTAGRYFVAEKDGRIVGIMSLINQPGATLEIGTLAVRRSRCREGVGSRLVQFAAAKAERIGKRKVSVGSFCFYGAKSFYLSLGFRIVFSGSYRGCRGHEFELSIFTRRNRKVCALFITSPMQYFKRQLGVLHIFRSYHFQYLRIPL